MEKQLKDYLKFYLPVKVELDNGGSKVYNRMAVAVGNTDDDFTYITLRMGTGAKSFTHSVLFSENRIKPILRPLDDWSLRETSEYGIEMDSFRSIIALGIYEPKLFHYLLSKHFDLFDLIPAGLAIDYKTINQ